MSNLNFAKMYPVGEASETHKPGVKSYSQGTTGTIDLSDVIEDEIYIAMSSASATAFNIKNIQPGMTLLIEQTGATAADHVCTFTDITVNVAGNNIATFDAIDESLMLFALTATRMIVLSNNGLVVLST